MSAYKVLIPSAGLGSRLGEFSNNLNKALISVDNKPVISHVIEKFPKHIELVIALGHKGKELKEYLNLAHSDRNITFVEIEKYQGQGSGLGLTILKCKEHLQCPFVFVPNDTIILEEIPEPDYNWIGFSESENQEQYRTVNITREFLVKSIHEKSEALSFNTKPYIGLSGIRDYKIFWEEMTSGQNYGSINVGESYALRKMLNLGLDVKARKFTWFDTGNLESLKIAKQKIKSKNSPEILEKNNEAIWFVNNRVIKYNKDENFISERVVRAQLLKGFVPEITSHGKNMYSYQELTGQVVSKVSNRKIFKNLLKYLEAFWKQVNLEEAEEGNFLKICNKFYKEKTLKRTKLYFDRFSEQDEEEYINGNKIPSLQKILDNVPWDRLEAGVPTRIHGDLHFENILLSESGEFFLLDWRQNFGGILEYGDIYYDLAKLYHGLIISHELINRNLFSVIKNDNIISYNFLRKNSLVENEKQLFEYISQKGLDEYKVKLLTSIIFLNIAPLHHYPYSKMLFYLGKESLYNLLMEEQYE